jgi:hypothetical protein
VAQRQQGVTGDLEGVTGKVPDKEERAGAHRNGGSTVRRRKRRPAAAFIGGEGAPVGGDGGCGVLQHRGGAHRGVADGGGARPESARESGLPVAGGGNPGVRSGGEARALERRSRRGVETGERVGMITLERRGRRRGREGKKREGGGPDVEVPCGARWRHGAWPRPAGGAPTVSQPAATRMRHAQAARRCSDSGALAPTGRAPVASRAGRHGWRVGARGPAREESGVVEPR